jgi:hypothetical protein
MSTDEFLYQDMVREVERLKEVQSEYFKMLQVLQEKNQNIVELKARLDELRLAYNKLLENVKAK